MRAILFVRPKCSHRCASRKETPLKPVLIWDVPGILPGCPGPLGVFRKFVQKKFVLILRSLFLVPEKYTVQKVDV